MLILEPGDWVLRRSQAIGKIAPRRDGPWEVLKISGPFRQRVWLKNPKGKPLCIHASKLVLYHQGERSDLPAPIARSSHVELVDHPPRGKRSR